MKSRLSEVDSAHKITNDWWVLTLARKNSNVFQQHAFFMLEGIENEKAVIWFMDFRGNPLKPNIKPGHTVVEKIIADTEDDLLKTPLIFRSEERGEKKKMMDLKEGDSITCKIWPIKKEEALKLVGSIVRDKERGPHQPIFCIFGKGSLLTGSSAYSSNKERGHNCFTYAKKKIEELKSTTVKIEPNPNAYYIEMLAEVTSLTLTRPVTLNPKNVEINTSFTTYCPYFSKKAVIGLATIAAAAICYHSFINK